MSYFLPWTYIYICTFGRYFYPKQHHTVNSRHILMVHAFLRIKLMILLLPYFLSYKNSHKNFFYITFTSNTNMIWFWLRTKGSIEMRSRIYWLPIFSNKYLEYLSKTQHHGPCRHQKQIRSARYNCLGAFFFFSMELKTCAPRNCVKPVRLELDVFNVLPFWYAMCFRWSVSGYRYAVCPYVG